MNKSCRIVQRSENPVLWPPVLIAQALAVGDLGITIAGIEAGVGTEVNPLFHWFTQFDPAVMIIGGIIYLAAVWIFFWYTSNWIRAITVGILCAIHFYGILSWVRLLYFPQVQQLFNLTLLLVGTGTIAAFMTMYTYVDIRTCPSPIDLNETQNTTTANIDWD